MANEVVIVGGGVAGIFVLRNLFAKKDAVPGGMHLTLIKREKSGWVSTCGLPFALRGWYELERTEIQKPESYLEQGVDFRAGNEVTKLNLDKNSVVLKTGEEITYDYLVIATGRKQSVKETKLDGVFTFNNEEDACKIEDALNTREVKNAFIRGRGIIGLQSAAAFAARGIKTTVLGGPPSLLPSSLDPDMGDLVKERMEKYGIRLILDRREITAMRGKEGWVKSVVIGEKEEKEEIPADIVIIGKWMVPETDLAKDSGIEIGETGGIVTDRSMHVQKGRRSLKNVYALGDCTEVVDGISHRPKLNQLASTAVAQARVIADNILSDITGQPGLYSSYEPCISPTVADVGGGLVMGSVGVTANAANHAGIKTISGKATKLIKARYFPGATSLTMKLIFDAFTKKLIGAQMVGEATVAERVNEFAVAIRVGMTAAELRNMERCFDPSLAQLEDVTIDAAKNALETTKSH
jgi:NADH oxidase (H2O2-forming)